MVSPSFSMLMMVALLPSASMRLLWVLQIPRSLWAGGWGGGDCEDEGELKELYKKQELSQVINYGA